ncbi:MBL fold metallo-hydrolase [Nonomuraea sp. 3-1Str]|uniref:MBL fold metallo-hydrolase n=1 Tax=Nonomuraea sp. 3-1Str TaxID=2929801 RepID=UPI002856F237|nr:MBL fold metallo-hydrolase [Nonomuraea sp. 3-1Str]MDR8410524.1 MBL fold metallo-hydrolase [Nonomuraea sp. 3-1Str]
MNPQDVRLIVVTHGHVDHFDSAAELSRLTGAPIAGHIADLSIYRAGGVSDPYLPIGLFGRLFIRSARVRETTEPFEPDLLIRGETHLSDLGVEARIMPTPGHTAGSASVLTNHGDLVAGDLVASPFLGLGKRPANPPFHDDRLGNLAILREMLALGPTKLHVGHGAPLNPEQVSRWASAEQRRLDRLAVRGRLRTKSEPGA